MERSESHALDPLTSAAMSVSTVIALNKPIYPLYVWWLAPDALKASLWTAASLPLWIALPFLARKNPYLARVSLVAVGAIDTAAIGMALGDGTGAWLFLFAALMLAAMSFEAAEVWTRRIAIASVFVVFALSYGRFPIGLAGAFSPESVATLFKLNAFGAAALLAFIGLRYPSSR
ncbi:hypothetical protein [Rhizobium sp. C4]|uniref:hypothetical protein n=1 Tax=Rhizobium sp. C4 TaxID=1349800 RepID=UPI001E40C406|nr:hypothetical protein [Rhizobium sp. C4]MCD2173473.1 hypothetical protein [Rhizobium sp. C4]